MSMTSIITAYEAADPDVRERGARWYDEAHQLAEQMAELTGKSIEHCAVAIAHLSPRVQWIMNKRGALALANGEPKPSGIMARSWLMARNALQSDDPWATFSKRARKTQTFARAILGDPDAVTVDVWAIRAAGEDYGDKAPNATQYRRLTSEYREAAEQLGVTPRDLQAITWVQTRGRAA